MGLKEALLNYFSGVVAGDPNATAKTAPADATTKPAGAAKASSSEQKNASRQSASSAVNALVNTAKNAAKTEMKAAGASPQEIKAELAMPDYSAKNLQETQKRRDDAVSEYNKTQQYRASLEAAGVADEEEEARLKAAKEKEAKLKADIDRDNAMLGQGLHLYTTADKLNAGIEGMYGERKAGLKGAVGNLLQAADLYGEQEARRALREAGFDDSGEMDHTVGNYGRQLFDTAREQNAKANEKWTQAVQDESQAVQFAANIAKAGANVALDQVDNLIIPGSGAVRMYAGAWGGAAMDQAGKENNSLEAQTLAGAKAAMSAWLSTKLLGGIETYGDSVAKKIVGEAIDKVAKTGTGQVAKVLLNTEGFEEALEDVLNYAGDKLLNLDPEAKLTWNEVLTDGAVGYILGVLTAGLSAGLNYTPSDLHQLVDEAFTSAQNGETFDQSVKNAGEANGTAEEAPIVRGRHEEGNTAPAPTVEAEAETETEIPSEFSMSNKEAERILNDPQARAEFEARINKTLDFTGMTKSEARALIKREAEARWRAERNAAVDDIMNEFRATEAEPEQQAAPVEEAPAEQQQESDRERWAREYEEEAPMRETFNENPTAEPTSQIAPESPQSEVASQPTNDTAEQAEENLSGLTRENANPQQTEQPPTENAPMPEADRRVMQENWDNASQTEKVSRYWSNTLMKNGRGDPNNPITYVPKSEQESLNRAYARLQADFEGEMQRLAAAEAWSGEQNDMAYLIEQQLNAEDRMEELQEWHRFMSQHIREAARGVQATAKQSRPDSLTVLRETENVLTDIEKTRKVDPKVVQDMRNTIGQMTRKMKQAEGLLRTDLENTREKVRGAKNRAESNDVKAAKEILLDLADELNQKRNAGFAFFLKGNAKADPELEAQSQKLVSKFHKMLAKQDIEFIQRFVACQAVGLAEDLNYDADADWGKRISTFQKLAQLTGTGTWLRNIEGNATFGLIDLMAADNPLALAVDRAISKKTGKRSSGFEKGMLEKGTLDAARNNLEKSLLEVAANIDLAEDSDTTKYDLHRTRTNNPGGEALERVLSKWEQWNGYMLSSSDAYFRGGIEHSVEQALIRANGWDADKLTASQKKEIEDTKKQVADYRLFQNHGFAADTANDIRDWANFNSARRVAKRGGQRNEFGIGTALLPYATVPANIGVKAVEFSPLNAAKGIYEIGKIMSDVKAGKDVSMAKQNQAVTDLGRGVTGTMLIAGLTALIRNFKFFKDWDNEENKNVRQQNKAEGKSGQQINLSMLGRYLAGDRKAEWKNGDNLIDISANEPLNQLITIAALVADGETKGTAYLQGMKNSLMDIPAMQTLQNIENQFKYTNTPEDLGQTLGTAIASTAGSVAGGFMPAPVRHLMNVIDPYQRETGGNNALERAGNQILAGSPFRGALDVKKDAYGNDVTAGDLGTRLATQYLASRYSQVNQSDVSREIQRIREETGDDYTPDYNGPKSMSYGSGKNKETVKLTTEQSREYKNTVGTEMNKAVEQLMWSSVYKDADPKVQSEILAEMKKYSGDLANDNLAKEEGIKRGNDYDDVRTLRDPVGYLASKVRFNEANKAEDWKDVDAVTKNLERMSESDRAFALDKSDELKSFWKASQAGVNATVHHQYKVNTKARAAERGSTSVSGADIFAEIAAGKYSKEAADYYMGQQNAKGYVAGKGRHAIYDAVTSAGYDADIALDFWNRTQNNTEDGTLTKKEFSRNINAFPEPYRSQIKKAVYAAMGW